MNLKCKCKSPTFSLKVEADFGADPIWCNLCGSNLDFEAIPLSKELKNKLMDWVLKYGEWINWNSDTLVADAFTMEDQHNKSGYLLTEEVKKELGSLEVVFQPSNSARIYATRDK